MQRIDHRLLLGYEETVADSEVTRLIGREEKIKVGADPEDRGVSRSAVTVSSAKDRWEVTPHNRWGVDLYLWGQASRALEGGRTERVCWPLAALLVHGTSTGEHWILLEDRAMRIPATGGGPTSIATDVAPRPPDLTDLQLEAVRQVFTWVLAWPPRPGALNRNFKAAAARLVKGESRTESALRAHLSAVRDKAMRLGLPWRPELHDPEYIYVLVRHGFLDPENLAVRQAAIYQTPGS